MADATRTIDIILGGQDQTGKLFTNVNTNLSKLSRGVKQAITPVAEITEKLLAAELAIAGFGVAIGKVEEDIAASARLIADRLNLIPESAEEINEVSKDLFTGGFVDSLEEGAERAITAFQTLGNLAPELLTKYSTLGQKIAGTFGQDFNKVLETADDLSQRFGISLDKSFDLITDGFQRGLDKSGDFLESLTEYSTQFSEGGASVEQFFATLESGQASGILGIDKAADSFKEFRIRIIDGSKSTTEALQQLGIDAEAFTASIANGSTSSIQAYDTILQRLRDTNDGAVRLQAGVGLLGTQFEDLGDKAALAINPMSGAFDNIAGSAENLQGINDGVTDNIVRAWRVVSVSLAEQGILEGVSSEFKEFLKFIQNEFPNAIKNVDFSGLLTALDRIKGQFGEAVSNLFGGVDLSTPQGLEEIIQRVVDAVALLTDFTASAVDTFQPFIGAIGGAAEALIGLDSGAASGAGAIGGYALQIKQFGLVAGIASIAINEMGLSGEAIGDLIGGGIKIAIGSFNNLLDVVNIGLEGFISFGAFIGGTLLNQIKRMLDAAAAITPDALGGSRLESLSDDLGGIIDGMAERSLQGVESINESLGDIGNNVTLADGFEQVQKGVTRGLLDITGESEKTAKALEGVKPASQKAQDGLDGIEQEGKKAAGGLKETGDAAQNTSQQLQKVGDAGTGALGPYARELETTRQAQLRLSVAVSDTELRMAQLKLAGKENTAEYRTLEKTLAKTTNELDKTSAVFAKLEQSSAVAQGKVLGVHDALRDLSSDERVRVIEARIDLNKAKIEADVRKVEAIFDSLGSSVEATATGISAAFSVFSNFGDLNSFQQKSALGFIQQQIDNQTTAIKAQERLTDAQIDSLQARSERLRSGDALITVDGDNLAPELEGMMVKVLEAVHIKATAEGTEYLLGLGS